MPTNILKPKPGMTKIGFPVKHTSCMPVNAGIDYSEAMIVMAMHLSSPWFYFNKDQVCN